MNLEAERGERLKLEAHIRPHNDRIAAARYFAERVQKRIAAGDRAALIYDVDAGIAMTAFALEAQVNFLGGQLFQNWNDEHEGKKSFSKLKMICRNLKLEAHPDTRPYSTFARLAAFRHRLVHPRSVTLIIDKVQSEKLDTEGARALLRSEDEGRTPEFLAMAVQDVGCWWESAVSAARLSDADTHSRVSWAYFPISSPADEKGGP